MITFILEVEDQDENGEDLMKSGKADRFLPILEDVLLASGFTIYYTRLKVTDWRLFV